MFATPPPSFRNAITELSITPFCAKTTSVPLDGRVFKATTLDAELATELEGGTLFETAQGSKNNFVIHWCQLSGLHNLSKIKAEALKTASGTPLFLSGYWEPSSIPHILRHVTTGGSGNAIRCKLPIEVADPSLSGSSTRTRRSQSNQSHRKTATTSVSKTRRSLRRESVTRTIPTTTLEETVEATVIPIAGSEESNIATWLNQIISSFSRLPALQGSNPDIPSPLGWNGPHFTRSKSAAGNNATYNNLRSWSSQYATKLVENSHMSVKPDIVFCGQLNPHTGFAWRNVISFLELTSSPHSAQLRRDITRKAYAVFMSQPGRRFVVAMSLARQEFRLHIFDRSGAIHSLGHNLHKSADLFTRVMYTLAFGGPSVLGFDPTFLDPSLTPSILFRPHTSTALKVSRTIYVGKSPYTVIRPIYISHLIRGRATNSWLVRQGQKSYVVKDYWTHKGRKYTEEEILSRFEGLLGAPQLIKAWTVQASGADETTDLLRPAFLVGNSQTETRIHRRLLLTPVGEPLVQFSSLRELVSIFIDIVYVLFILVDTYGILHRDISFNNILAFACDVRWPVTSADLQDREDIIAENKYQRGLLIDFDYSELINNGKQGVSSGDRTGTIPFMAIDLLQEYNSPSNGFTHTLSHDLESLVYVLVWVCVLYQGPNEIRSDRNVEQTCLKQWALAKTSTDIQALCDQKLGQLSSRSVLSDFTPYFEPLKPTVTRLYKLIQCSREADDTAALTHAAVMEVFMDAFKTVTELSCGATNAKRAWQRVRNEPAPTQAHYYSEGRNVRRKVM